MAYRVGYYTTGKRIFAASESVASDEFDDTGKSTSVELDSPIPDDILRLIYNDDSEGNEVVESMTKGGCYYELTTALTDTDGDGIVDINADGSTTNNITITKKAADGSTILTDVEDYFCEIHGGGALDKAEGSLDSSGEDTIVLQGSLNTGMVVTVKVWPQTPEQEDDVTAQPEPGELRVKFI